MLLIDQRRNRLRHECCKRYANFWQSSKYLKLIEKYFLGLAGDKISRSRPDTDCQRMTMFVMRRFGWSQRGRLRPEDLPRRLPHGSRLPY